MGRKPKESVEPKTVIKVLKGLPVSKTKPTTSEENPEFDFENNLPGTMLPEPDNGVSPEYEQKLSDWKGKFLGHAFKVRVEKYNPADKDFDHLDLIMLDGFDEFEMGKTYGPGRYRFSLLDEDGKYHVGGRTHFRYAGKAVPVDDNRHDDNPFNNPLVQMMFENQKQQAAMLMDVLKATIPARAEADKGNDITKLIGALKDLKAMSPKEEGGNAMKSVKDALDLAKQLKDLGGDSNNGGDSGGFMSDIKDALQVVAALKTPPPMQRPPGPRPQTQPRPTPGAVTPGSPIVINKEPPMLPGISKILFYVPKFQEAASKNESHEKWAEFLLTILDTDVVPDLVSAYGGFLRNNVANGETKEDVAMGLISDAGKDAHKIEKIFVYAPVLAPYRDWVLAVVSKAVDLYENGPTDEPETSLLNGSEVLPLEEKTN